LSCRKELKDPDQLYNTLKNLLAQIKVRAGGDPPLRGARPPGSPGLCPRGAGGVTQVHGQWDPCVMGSGTPV